MRLGGGGGQLGRIIYPSGDYTTGLINNWPMNDANVSGTQITDVTSSNNGTAAAGVTSGTGPGSGAAATARSFNGSTSPIPITSSPFDWDSGSFSIAGWIRLVDVTLSQGGNRVTFFQDTRASGTNLHFVRICNSAAVLQCITSGNAWLTPAATLVNNQWTHFVFTNSGGGSGGTGTVYIGGNSVALSTSTGQADNGDAPNYASIGAENANPPSAGSSTGLIGGLMYALRIYNRVLTSADALALFNAMV